MDAPNGEPPSDDGKFFPRVPQLYIGDVPPARTSVFALGLLSSIALFVLAAFA